MSATSDSNGSKLSRMLDSEVSDLINKYCSESAPRPARMMAAKAIAPMSPNDQIVALYQLSFDKDSEIAATSLVSASQLSEEPLKQSLRSTEHSGVLDFYSRHWTSGEILETIVLNSHTNGATLTRICTASKSAQLLVLISNNQRRILEYPDIVSALYHNRHMPLSSMQKVLELVVRNDLLVEGIPELDAVKESILSPDASSISEQDDTAFEAAVNTTEENSSQESSRNLSSQQIKELPLFAKVRLATIGNSFHRAVLIKDRNRTVYMAAIRSPALREKEAIKFSGIKELEEDVIRYIANKREWHRSYSLKLNLVNNPKCPLPVALKLLAHLRQNDLRQIARSRSIPANVARSAKQAMLRRS